MIVIDASVATKWVVDEPGTPAAAAIIEDRKIRLIAPAIIRLEVTSACLRCHRQNRLPANEVRSAIDDWRAILASGRLQLYRMTTSSMRPLILPYRAVTRSMTVSMWPYWNSTMLG